MECKYFSYPAPWFVLIPRSSCRACFRMWQSLKRIKRDYIPSMYYKYKLYINNNPFGIIAISISLRLKDKNGKVGIANMLL